MIETATQACSVAIADQNGIIIYKELSEPKAQAALLAPLIDEALKEAGIKAKECEAVSVSIGPGSYTGLRVGLSTAKGICFGANIKLVGIETLEILAQEAISSLEHHESENTPLNTLIVPMIDARRMEVYTACYDSEGAKLSPTEAMILDENSFAEYFEKYDRLIFIGDGVEKFEKILPDERLRSSKFVKTTPSARYMLNPTLNKVDKISYEDVAYFEPFYLKEFVAGISKKSQNALLGRD